MFDAAVFEGLACCVAYPREDTKHAARSVARALERSEQPSAKELAERLEALAEWLVAAKPGEAEERFTQLFDLDPVCTMNLSHHLLGDTYARGELLAALVAELSRVGIQRGNDLPDHFPTLLRLLGRLHDHEDRVLLAHTLLLPGLSKMCAALERSPDALPAMIRAIPAFLEDCVPKGEIEVPQFKRPLEVLPCSM